MATTAQQVFEICMDFADERDDSGSINPTNTASYKVRTPGILTSLQAELIGYDGPSNAIIKITDVLQIDDVRAKTILPYRLGAELFKEENDDIYKHFMARCRELKHLKRPAVEKPIKDAYGVNFIG